MGWFSAAAAVDTGELPAPLAGKVEFRKDILPILETHCFRCHGPERPKSGFRLDNRASALAGGDQGEPILPGHSADSPLIHFVARLDREMAMPPTGKGDPLKPYEIALLRAWIDQGVDYGGADQPARAGLTLSVSAGAGYVGVEGDRGKFREQAWLNDGWSGGVTDFSAQGPLDERTTFQMDGRVVAGQDDAQFRFELRRKEWGGVAGGVETRRRWYDDSGGYHPSFNPPQFASGNDLYLDFGRAWFDVFVERENWPELRLGYELQFREGTESLTRWGITSTNASGGVRTIYPSTKAIDEQTHILKFDVAKDFSGWRLADSLRVEWHDQDNRSVMATAFNTSKPGPEKFTDVHEGYGHTMGANSLTVEKALREWAVIHGGYLYSWLDGTASFDQSSFLTDNATLPPAVALTAFGPFADRFFNTSRIVLEQESNVGSFGARLGPWEEVVLYGGVQGDWSRQHGFSDLTRRFGTRTNTSRQLSWSDLERQVIEERAGLRFTGLPFSTLYAEGRWRQEQVDQYEDQRIGAITTLNRGTDAVARLDQYRAGFSTSPWQAVMLAAHYQIADANTDYLPTADDASPGPQEAGYPNFLTGRSSDLEEVEASLTARLSSQVKLRFKYQNEQTEFETRHYPLFGVVPGGARHAGEQDADIFSAGVNWLAGARWSIDVTGSYADTRLATFANNVFSIVPYAGQVWSVGASAHWAVDDLTRLAASYAWSRADYEQDNFAAGLPLGIRYQWHQLRAGADRRLNDQLSVNLLYLFQSYAEPTAGGFNDYTAHGVFAGLTWRWKE